MSTAAGIVRQHRHRLVPAYVAAIVLGIFGMHALVQHCPTPTHAMASATASAQTVGHHADAYLMGAPAAVIAVDAVQLLEQPGNNLGEMLMLCAAMLLGAGAVLALLDRRPSTRPLGLLRTRYVAWQPTLLVAAIGPPPSLAFTVIRC